MGLRINGRDADFTVPATNSVANFSMADVIGSKLDDNLGDSLFARLDELYDQFQAERRCYPNLVGGAPIISPAGVWTFGNYATIVPINTIVNPYHVMAVVIETCTIAAGTFQLGLYKGAVDDLITEVRFSIVGGFFGNSVYIVGSEEVNALAQIRGRLACSVGAATVTVSIIYLEHT